MREEIQVLIAGAGASGLMASVICAAYGKRVLVIEHKEKPGKKILATGNGKCNFTNAFLKPECFRSERNDLAWRALTKFNEKDSLHFFEALGVLAKEKNGYYYPCSGQAVTILDALLEEAKRLGVILCCNEKLKRVEKKEDFFYVQTDLRTITAKQVIVAVGGKAAPKLGTEGNGYKIARKFEHTVVPTVPALTGICCEKMNLIKDWAGVRTDGTAVLYIEDRKTAEDTGELQLTDYGVSGIPIFQVSRYAAKALYEKKKVVIELDFIPLLSEDACVQWLLRQQKENPNKQVLSMAAGMVNKKLAKVWLRQCGIEEKDSLEKLSKKKIAQMVYRLKQWKLIVKETNGFDKAQTTAGGISLEEIDMDTMESRKVKGLYFTGEILDVDGICGGYNLQWAWTSGYLAGKAAGNRK